ncbi:hypothetical protein [Jatrophihabitans lederbergiae]|uniref:DUF1440 domain-containing protein n=1 Tax=Jatrophihabitans lederbergiae TaxID=3075547 RepID=A0ABU2JC44_9ACTN|nr:hypothetical protein [Jatrophihabitans sp. DSM 44399]MDT0262559.1 hypothetical protein [Jatrophihabitans sp. DSM 44399]
MFRALLRGAAAGAAGTTALNAVTYLDMAVRARPASSTPQQSVEVLAQKLGHPVPGEGERHENRLAGLGPLNGIAVGVGIGAVAGLLRPVLARLSLPVGATVIGAAALAAANIPMKRLGVSDPATWSAADWVSDVVPHAAFGLVTHATLRAGSPSSAVAAAAAGKAATAAPARTVTAASRKALTAASRKAFTAVPRGAFTAVPRRTFAAVPAKAAVIEARGKALAAAAAARKAAGSRTAGSASFRADSSPTDDSTQR